MRLILHLLCALMVASSWVPARAEVLHSRDEALAMAFPNGEEVRALDFYLTPEQRSEIEQQARAKLESNLLTVYAGYKDGKVTGYALFDTQVVRTLPETLLIVLDPAGVVRAVHLLAFYEPAEYAPPAAWLGRFVGAQADRTKDLARSVDAIAGSTLTSRAVANAVARALAIHSVLLARGG